MTGDLSGWILPALANHLWQSTILVMAVWLLVTCFRRAPARLRYGLWVIALAKFAVPSSLLSALGASLAPNLTLLSSEPSRSWLANAFEPLAPASASLRVEAGPTAASYVVAALVLVWAGGAIACFAWWYVRRRRFAAAVASGARHTSGREADAVEFVRRRLGLVVWSSVVTCAEATEPGVWGVWRPVIILPEGLAERLSDGELEMLMLHEMSHVVRRDNLVANLQRVLCCCLWFYPLVWLLDRHLRAERESACDEAVLAIDADADVYAASLLNVSRFSIESIGVAGRSSMAGPNTRRRIEHIMTGKAQRRLTVGSRLAFGSAVLFLTITSIALGGSAAARSAPDNSKRQAAADLLPAAREAMVASKAKNESLESPSVQVAVAVKRWDAETALVALVLGASDAETLGRYSHLKVTNRPIVLGGGTSYTTVANGIASDTGGLTEVSLFVPMPKEANGLLMAIQLGDDARNGFKLVMNTPDEIVTSVSSMGMPPTE